MPVKIGKGSQIINQNFITEFVSENLNKLLWQLFSPGVLKFSFKNPPLSSEIEILDFSALIRPRNKNFLVKVDTHTSLKIVANPNKPYLIARMDWLIPSINGYSYDTANYMVGMSGYSGYFFDPTFSCTLNSTTNTVLLTNHTLSVGDIIRFDLTIGGVIKDIDYYIIEVATGSFKISETTTGISTIITSSVPNSFRKMNTHIVRFDMISSDTFDSTYDILLGELKFTSGLLTSVDITNQTQVHLSDNCINYDLVQRSGVRTLDGTNPSYIDDGVIQRKPGYASGNIPISDNTININLNTQYLNGITASNADNSIGLKNNILSKNMTSARLFLGNYEYAIGQSGLTSYSGFSGYTGISGWSGVSGFSAYSGYLPLNNTILQTRLNAEYFGGYKLSDFSMIGHSHNLDEIIDGSTYAKLGGVDTDGLVKTEGLYDGALEYRHQSITNPFRYDNTVEKKIFILTGEIGLGGSTSVSFRKTFADPPRVFLLNQETSEWKSVTDNGTNITTTGFIINHTENTSGASLMADTTPFSTSWLAVGELV